MVKRLCKITMTISAFQSRADTVLTTWRLWNVFLFDTDRFEQAFPIFQLSTPVIAHVLPVVHRILEHSKNCKLAEKQHRHQSLRFCAKKANRFSTEVLKKPWTLCFCGSLASICKILLVMFHQRFWNNRAKTQGFHVGGNGSPRKKTRQNKCVKLILLPSQFLLGSTCFYFFAPGSLHSRKTNSNGTFREEKLAKYITEPGENQGCNLFVYWKSCENDFPRLSKVAKKLFSAKEATACVERSFIYAGMIPSNKRLHTTDIFNFQICFCAGWTMAIWNSVCDACSL